MGDDAAPTPAQVTTGVPGKVVVNGELMEPANLRAPVATPLAAAPQQPQWEPPVYHRATRPKEPEGPLAPVEKTKPVEQLFSDALGTAALWVLALVAVGLLAYWGLN